jgi:hypothetical protein
VVIVTCKSHALLDKCLASVGEHLRELPVYVYENSGGGYSGREALAYRHPRVHWVFGPPSGADLLAVNPDARLRGPLSQARQLPRAGSIGGVAESPRSCRARSATVRRRSPVRDADPAAEYAAGQCVSGDRDRALGAP